MTLVERLLDKAKEAFVMAIELYNKPTIHYRLEGFSFFICNAWELMLKAYLVKRDGEQAIYFPDKPNRTISLENCIQKVFTNEEVQQKEMLTPGAKDSQRNRLLPFGNPAFIPLKLATLL